MSVEEAFSSIYRNNEWGGLAGELHSGLGSSHPGIVLPYLAVVRELLAAIPAERRTIVDLGCGDFRVGAQLVDYCSSYIALDVVEELIRVLRTESYPQKVQFRHSDIVIDDLPFANVCLVRQVFQHLSNEQILAVLPKLRMYPHIVLTEHFPPPGQPVIPNLDKVHGPGVRLEEGSAVCLDHPPFNVPASALTLLCAVPADGSGQGRACGSVRTFLFSGTDIPD
jgi:hypothetical protein